jgi:tetratricopeptide (TPR) repeat protein
MVALGPRAGHALWAVGHTARFTNRPRQALRALSRIELESGWGREWAPRILGEMGRDHHLLGEHEQELERVRQALRFLPDDGWVRTNEVIALAALRQYNELAQRVEAAMVLPETPSAWETYSGGDLLMQVARELAAHGAPADTSRRYAEAAVAWYEPLTATGTADSVHLLGHARAAVTAGRHDAALELYRQLVAINPESPEFMAGAAAALARLGDTAAAEEGLRRLRAVDRPYHFGYPARWAANVAAVLGRREEAVRLLGESLKQGQTWLFRWHADPDLAGLRDYRPFRELIRPR